MSGSPQTFENTFAPSLSYFFFFWGNFFLFVFHPLPSATPAPSQDTPPRGVGRGGRFSPAGRCRVRGWRGLTGPGGAGAGAGAAGGERAPPAASPGMLRAPGEPVLGRFPYPGIAGHIAIGPCCHMDSNFVHLTVSRRVSRNRKTSKGGDRNKF